MEEFKNNDLENESIPEEPKAPETPAAEPPRNDIPSYVPPQESTFKVDAPEAMPPRPPVDPAKRESGDMAPPAPPQHSGEYRYVPPHSGIGSNTARPDGQGEPTPPARPEYIPRPNPQPEKPKKERTVRTFSTTALILILAGAVLLSFASGMLGALFVNGNLDFIDESKVTEPQENSSANNEDDTKNDGKNDSELIVNKADEDEDSDKGQLVGSYDITDVCAVVSASVVEITTEFNETYYGYYQYVQEGAGSGVIVSKDGYIITNAHVITNSENGKLADAIKIRLNSGDEYEAKIIGSDNDSDIALLKVDANNLKAATVGNSDKIEVGEQIIAVGNPLGELGGTVTSGIVSATNREITVENNKMTLIQIDAAINPGNSGGGLFNTKGELIGIVNAKTTDVTVEGLGFAIPVNEAVSVVEELESHGYVTGKTYLGISLTDVTDGFTAYYYFRSESTGVYITSVQKGYNDDVLEYGDRITAINDNEIASSSDVKEIISESEVGDKLTFTISRDGKIKDVEVTCYEYVPEDDVSFKEN